MKISIALAAYNGEQFIVDQLESFSRQVRLPDEVIVSDDGSSDKTVELIREFGKTAPFELLVYSNPLERGYCQNFNNALSHTTGDLVFLSDQDDVWFPKKISTVLKIAKSSDSLLIMNDAELTDQNLMSLGFTKRDRLQQLGYDDSKFVMGCCVALKRPLLNLALPIDPSFPAHDTWLVWLSDLLGAKLVLPEVLQYYRRHESNESQFLANKSERRFNKAVDFTRLVLSSVKDDTDALSQTFRAYKIFHARIHELCDVHTDRDLEALLLAAKEESDYRVSCLSERISLRSTQFLVRLVRATKFFLKGHYRGFSGYRSYVRDLLYP